MNPRGKRSRARRRAARYLRTAHKRMAKAEGNGDYLAAYAILVRSGEIAAEKMGVKPVEMDDDQSVPF